MLKYLISREIVWIRIEVKLIGVKAMAPFTLIGRIDIAARSIQTHPNADTIIGLLQIEAYYLIQKSTNILRPFQMRKRGVEEKPITEKYGTRRNTDLQF